MKKILAAIERGKKLIAGARKAAVPAVAALGLIVGTDAPLYVDVVLVLVAIGVYRIPNATE